MKEQVTLRKATDVQIVSGESINIQEKFKELENRIELLEFIAKKTLPEAQLEPQQEMKTVIQINAYRTGEKPRKYFCMTKQEQSVFSENNPGVKTETFNVDLPVFVAEERLNNAENKKQFVVRKKD